MKKTRARSFPVLMLTLAFFAGLVYFLVNLCLNSRTWASMPQNGHLADSGSLGNAGAIYDRNGVVLAKSTGSRRVYNEDEAVRCACLPVVGDDGVFNSTAIQTIYRSQLTGYDFVFGLGIPEELKKKNDMTLTVDSRVQTAACEALGDRRGAVVVYNYKTGEIICLASTPVYDPENKPEDIDTNDKYEGAYLNRAVSAAYPPGSTFKLITSAAALENIEGSKDRMYYCQGEDTIGGKEVTCYTASGEVDFKHALMYSCNCFFAELAVEAGKSIMTAQAEKAGFNSTISFDGIESAVSTYDVSEASENDLAWSGVGQYTVMETPINMAVISAAIANGGIPVMPYIVKKNSSDRIEYGKRVMKEETAAAIKEMMDDTVDEYYGSDIFSSGLDVCAKTGTAEVGGDEGAHAWVTGFILNEEYPYAFSVIVEHGDSGYGAAVPVAREVLGTACN